MSIAQKTVKGLIIYAAPESNYGTGGALGSSNTIQVAEALPTFDINYSYNGDRKAGQYSGGNLRRATPSGRSTTAKVMIELKGLGSAYTTASTPPNLHPFLLASGLSGSCNGGTWVYSPTPLNTTSSAMCLEVYGRNEKLPISGAFCQFVLNAPDAGIATAEFTVQGMCQIPTDQPLAVSRSFTAAAVIPPKMELISLSIGSYTTANIRNWNYDHKQTVVPRINQNASGSFAGYALGKRAPVFKTLIEADLLTNYNPQSDYANGTQRAITMTVGQAGTNNNYTLSFPSASIASVKNTADANVIAMWEIEFAPAVSAPDAEDDMSLTFGS